MFPRRAPSQIEKARIEWAQRMAAQRQPQRQFGGNRGNPQVMREQSLVRGTAAAMAGGHPYDPRMARTAVRQGVVVSRPTGWGLPKSRQMPRTARAARRR